MIPRSVQNVQLVNVSPDAVEFPMKVLDGGCVLVVNFLVDPRPRRDGELVSFTPEMTRERLCLLHEAKHISSCV